MTEFLTFLFRCLFFFFWTCMVYKSHSKNFHRLLTLISCHVNTIVIHGCYHSKNNELNRFSIDRCATIFINYGIKKFKKRSLSSMKRGFFHGFPRGFNLTIWGVHHFTLSTQLNLALKRLCKIAFKLLTHVWCTN